MQFYGHILIWFKCTVLHPVWNMFLEGFCSRRALREVPQMAWRWDQSTGRKESSNPARHSRGGVPSTESPQNSQRCSSLPGSRRSQMGQDTCSTRRSPWSSAAGWKRRPWSGSWQSCRSPWRWKGAVTPVSSDCTRPRRRTPTWLFGSALRKGKLGSTRPWCCRTPPTISRCRSPEKTTVLSSSTWNSDCYPRFVYLPHFYWEFILKCSAGDMGKGSSEGYLAARLDKAWAKKVEAACLLPWVGLCDPRKKQPVH